MPYNYGVVGQPSAAGDQSAVPTRAGRLYETITQDCHGRYAEAVLRGNVYLIANQSAATWSSGLTTTYVGCALINPVGSSKLLSVLQVDFATSTFVAGITGLAIVPYTATGITNTTTLTVQKCWVPSATGGQGTASGTGMAGGNLVTPVYSRFLQGNLATSTGGISTFDIGGSIMLSAGTALAIVNNAAITGFGSITWEELPFTS
jgi:hypothetical protein